MVAAWYGHIEMMALFVERGADLRRSNRNGEQACNWRPGAGIWRQ
jgi:ankyrin repeat protein